MSLSVLNYWGKAFRRAFGDTHWFKLRTFMGTVGVAILASLLGVVRFSLGTRADVLKTAFSLLLCYSGVAVISFLANLIRTPALLEHELKTKLDGEMSELREQIIKLSIKPYDEALEKEVAELRAKLPPETEKVLRFLLPRGEMNQYAILEALKNEVNSPDVASILDKAVNMGLLKSRVGESSGRRSFSFPIRYYSIPENFVPVLRELLHSG